MISFKVEKDGEKFHAFCPELIGCHTFGNTAEEALRNLKNAVSLYLDDELEVVPGDNFSSTLPSLL